MAFTFTEQTIGGLSVSFHKVTATRLDMSTGAAEATLSSWQDQASAQRGTSPILTRTFAFTPDGGLLHQSAQAQILSDPAWAGAEVL